MKKAITFIIIIISSFLVPNLKAQNPCDFCLAPKICYPLTLNITGCGNIDYVICYQCSITSNSLTADIYSINGVCPGYEDAAWDAVYEWIEQNKSALCGNMPCEVGTSHVKITYPKCGKLIYDGNISLKYKIEYDSQCPILCIYEYDWCYCNCIATCENDPGCPAPHIKISNETLYVDWGYGTCNNQPIILEPGKPKEISCQTFHTKCDIP